MALEIFKLFGSIMVNNEDANKSLSKTDEKAEGVGQRFLGGIGKAAKWGAAVGAAAGAGATAMFGIATKSSEATDRIDKLSNKIGISKQGFQEWDYIMGQNGMDVEKLQVGVKTLTSKMDAAAGGSKSAADSFGSLGLTWDDGNGKLKSQEEMMNESIMALANMENGTEKAKLATELFGKAGIEMMPMLNNGAEGITELKDRAHDLGLVMSDEAVNAGVVFGDTLDDVKDSFGMVTTQIGVEVMPIIQSMMDWVLAHMPEIQTIFSTVFEGISLFVQGVVLLIQEAIGIFNTIFGGVVESVIGFVGNFKSNMNETGSIIESIKQALTDVFGESAANLFQAFIDTFNTVKENISPIIEGIKTVFSVFMDFLKTAWETVGRPVFDFIMEIVAKVLDVFNAIFPVLADVFKGLCDTLSLLWENILKPVFQAIGWLLENILLPAFSGVFGAVAEVVKAAFSFIGELWNNSLKPILDGIILFIGGIFKGDWGQVWDGICSILSGIWGGIKTILWTPIKWFIDLISPIAEKVIAPFKKAAGAIGNIWSSIKDFFKLPHFTFTGSLNPKKWADEGLPKLGVDWYYNGGIFKKPTLLPGGKGVGDRFNGKGSNPEAVVPLDEMYENINNIVANNADKKQNAGGIVINIEHFENNRKQDIEELADELAFYLGRKELIPT